MQQLHRKAVESVVCIRVEMDQSTVRPYIRKPLPHPTKVVVAVPVDGIIIYVDPVLPVVVVPQFKVREEIERLVGDDVKI